MPSDDSWGRLEHWGLGIVTHPKIKERKQTEKQSCGGPTQRTEINVTRGRVMSGWRYTWRNTSRAKKLQCEARDRTGVQKTDGHTDSGTEAAESMLAVEGTH